MKSILFVGMYPNAIDPFRNVFFRNLIFAIADMGIKCVVISPVSITKYGFGISRIPLKEIQSTNNGAKVDVYYPRYISLSAKNIFGYNTCKATEYLFEHCALKTAEKLNNTFDCVYGHFILLGGLAAVRIGRTLKIPSFIAYGECDYHSEVGCKYGVPSWEQLENLTGIISVSTKNTLELEKVGISKDKPILTAPNSVDMTLFYTMDKNECRKKLSLPIDKFIVGFVGYFKERKGDKRLLEAANQLDDVYLAYAGSGEKPPNGEKVLFCKALNHEDIPVFLNAIDVFCLPTLNEGSCNAIVEAGACGCPIISSDMLFNDDLLNNKNSIRINPKNVNEIRDAISTLYEDERLRERLTKQIIKDCQEFSIENRAIRIMEFIEQYLN